MIVTGNETNPWLRAGRTPASVATAPPLNDSAPASITEMEEEQQSVDEVEGTLSEPSEEVAMPQRTGAVFLSAHGGAGATMWSSAFTGHDGGLVTTWERDITPGDGVVLVLRSTVNGITAAKKAIGRYGKDSFTCVLAVAAAPGREPRLIHDELKVLAGAVTVVRVPWIQTLILRRSALVTSKDIPAKDLTKITAALIKAGVTLKGETK